MEKIYIIGDIHTVSAFQMSGATGVVSDRDGAAARLEEVIRKGDAAIVAVTNELADGLQYHIRDVNLNLPAPLVIAIPGIDDEQGFGRSVISYISEALGIAL